MALSVWTNPKVRELLGEINALASDEQIDEFFWLKARRVPGAQGAGTTLELYGDHLLGRRKKPNWPETYRIANIVLQGGGVLGLAHAGFVAGLEHAGVRFAGIAGASAGAIMAMGMTAVRGDDLLQETSRKIVGIVGGMPMASFIDGPYRTRWLVKQFLLKRLSYFPSTWVPAIGALRRIVAKRGLNPGNTFEDWLRGILAEEGLRTLDDLRGRLRTIRDQLDSARWVGKEGDSNWQLGDQNPVDGAQAHGSELPREPSPGGSEELLQIMAACTPLGIKFQFPRDAVYLSVETQSNSPAQLVRASMSIPLFFEPITFNVRKGANWGNFVREALGELVGKEKTDDFADLDEIAFLDGGIFSNLPVDAFRETMPDVPTIAIPLVSGSLAKPYRRRASLQSLIDDAGTVAFMVRNQRDRDAIEQLRRLRRNFERQANPQRPRVYPFQLAAIDVGTINWLNFVMDEIEMTELFRKGLERAKKFLEHIKNGGARK